jgi:hypothetical protein
MHNARLLSRALCQPSPSATPGTLMPGHMLDELLQGPAADRARILNFEFNLWMSLRQKVQTLNFFIICCTLSVAMSASPPAA